MRQRTVERIMVIGFVILGTQTAVGLLETDAAGWLRYGGLCCVALGTLGMLLAGFDIGIGSLPGQPSRSELGGASVIALSLGWLAVPVATATTASLGVSNILGVVIGIFLTWSGVQMVREHDQYRFADPGEDLQAKLAERGRNASVGRIVRDEALRSIGVFGLLYITTLVVVAPLSSAGPADPWVYVPATTGAVASAALLAQLRLRTGAGPRFGQIRRAARQHGWTPLGG